MNAPSARLIPGHEAPRSERRHRQHTAIMPGSGPARRPLYPIRRHQPRLHPGWTPRSSSGTPEPVTAPAGARAAHPPPHTPARDHPHQASRPTFRGNPTPPTPRDLYGLSEEGGRDDVDESLRACRSRSSTRAESRSICAVSSAISRYASASRTASSAAGRADSSSVEGTPGTPVTPGNDHHSGQPVNNPPRRVASHPLAVTTHIAAQPDARDQVVIPRE